LRIALEANNSQATVVFQDAKQCQYYKGGVNTDCKA